MKVRSFLVLIVILYINLQHITECSEVECKVHYNILRNPESTYQRAYKQCKSFTGGQLAMLKSKKYFEALEKIPYVDNDLVLVGAHLDLSSGVDPKFYWNDGEEVKNQLWADDFTKSTRLDPDKQCASISLISSNHSLLEVQGLVAVNCANITAFLCQWCIGNIPEKFRPSPRFANLQGNVVCRSGAVKYKSYDTEYKSERCLRGYPSHCQRLVQCFPFQCRQLSHLTQRCHNKTCYCASHEDCLGTSGQGFCMHGCVRERLHEDCLERACEVGRYGDNCEKNCACGYGIGCSKDSGICNKLIRCDHELYGVNCDRKLCNTGRWGAKCKKFCMCKDSLPCQSSTGLCPNGCQDGWLGRTCSETACPLGSYGNGCNQTCDCNQVFCSQNNGQCPKSIWKRQEGEAPVGDQGTTNVVPVGHHSTTIVVPDEHHATTIPAEEYCPSEKKWGQACDMTCVTEGCIRCDRDTGTRCTACAEGINLHKNGTCGSSVEPPKKEKPTEEEEGSGGTIVAVLVVVLIVILIGIGVGLKRTKPKPKPPLPEPEPEPEKPPTSRPNDEEGEEKINLNELDPGTSKTDSSGTSVDSAGSSALSDPFSGGASSVASSAISTNS